MIKNINNDTIIILIMPREDDTQEKTSQLEIMEEERRKEKYKILSKIEDLENNAKKAMMTGNFEKAINISEDIIRLSIIGDLPKYIEEQQAFLNEIALKVSKEYTIKEINKVGNGIKKIYEVLIEAENFKEAHNILNDFKENYSNFPYFNTIPLIQELLKMDERLWMKYQIALDKVEKDAESHENIEDKYGIKEELEEIKKFLKKMPIG